MRVGSSDDVLVWPPDGVAPTDTVAESCWDLESVVDGVPGDTDPLTVFEDGGDNVRVPVLGGGGLIVVVGSFVVDAGLVVLRVSVGRVVGVPSLVFVWLSGIDEDREIDTVGGTSSEDVEESEPVTDIVDVVTSEKV